MVYQPLLTIVFTAINWHLTGKVVDFTNSILIALYGLWLGAEFLNLELTKKKLFTAFKIFTVSLAILSTVVEPVWFSIMTRRLSQDINLVHDGLVQLEIATEGFARGENPYTIDYFKTRLKDWYYLGPVAINPALYHFTYLPSLVIFNRLATKLTQFWLGLTDARVLFILAYLAVLLLSFLAGFKKGKLIDFLIIFGLNPLTYQFLENGRNDIFPFFWILLSLVFLTRNHRLLSSLAVAVAVGAKQPSWFLIPFFLAYWFFHDSKESFVVKLIPAVSLLFGAAIFCLPFIFSNPEAFVRSTINYPLGIGKTAYPVAQWSLGFTRLLATVFPPHHWASKVFGFSRVLLLITFGVYLLRRQKANNRPAEVLINYGLFLFAFWYLVVTYFYDNHVLFIVWILGASQLFNPSPHRSLRT